MSDWRSQKRQARVALIDVKNAIDHLRSQGMNNPSLRAIHGVIGRGSLDKINFFKKQLEDSLEYNPTNIQNHLNLLTPNSHLVYKNISFFGELSQANLPKQLPSFGIVYALELDNGLVKIGCSSQPARRIQELKKTIRMYGNTYVTCVALSEACTNYKELEAELHKFFGQFRVDGELFQVNILNVVNAIGQMSLISQRSQALSTDVVKPTSEETNQYVVREFNDSPIKQRQSDGYFDATAMCQATNKRWVDYAENKYTQLFFQELSKSENLAPLELIQSKQGRYGGTWIHPHIAVNLAQWCSPQFAVQVSKWVYELMSKGSVNINPDQVVISKDELISLQRERISFLEQQVEKLSTNK